jgi:hypothetical protein
MDKELLIATLASALKAEARVLTIYNNLNLSEDQKEQMKKDYPHNVKLLAANLPLQLVPLLDKVLNKNHPGLF